MPSPTRFLQSSFSQLPSPPPPPSSISFDSDVVVVLAALLCALICVVGLVLVARCSWLRRSSSSTAAASAAGSSASSSSSSSATPPPPATAPNKGLKKKALRSLPTVRFDVSARIAGKLGDCAICLAEFADGEEIRILPQCGHGFHVACIDTWLGSHSSCPSCRRILVIPAPSRCHKCGASSPGASGGAGSSTVAEGGAKAAGEAGESSFLP